MFAAGGEAHGGDDVASRRDFFKGAIGKHPRSVTVINQLGHPEEELEQVGAMAFGFDWGFWRRERAATGRAR